MPEAPFSTRFREARRHRQLTQAAVAKSLGVSQSAIAQWESGRNYPSMELAPKIEKVVGIRFQLADQAQQIQPRRLPTERPRLPIIGVPAPSDDERILVDGRPHGDIIAPPQLEAVAGAQAVYVRGRAMEPRYFSGEVVYLHPTRPANPGDFVFVTVKEPGFPTSVGYVRQYVGEDLVHVRLQTLNPKREQVIGKDDLVSMAVIVGAGLL